MTIRKARDIRIVTRAKGVILELCDHKEENELIQKLNELIAQYIKAYGYFHYLNYMLHQITSVPANQVIVTYGNKPIRLVADPDEKLLACLVRYSNDGMELPWRVQYGKDVRYL